jgi:hypothetical protein
MDACTPRHARANVARIAALRGYKVTNLSAFIEECRPAAAPLVIVQSDQFGILHPPCARARSYLWSVCAAGIAERTAHVSHTIRAHTAGNGAIYRAILCAIRRATNARGVLPLAPPPLPPASANRLVSARLCGGRCENGCGAVVVAMHTRAGTAAQLVAVAASELFPDLPRSDAIGCSGHTHP